MASGLAFGASCSFGRWGQRDYGGHGGHGGHVGFDSLPAHTLTRLFSTSHGADVAQSNPEVIASAVRPGEDGGGDYSEGAAVVGDNEGAATGDNSAGAAEVEEPSIPVVAMADSRPIVVIVGRPNVGKSALFNKLMRRREALVCDTPQGHMTRDVREGVCSFFGLRFRVFDTAGLEPATSASHQGHDGSGQGEIGGVSRVMGFTPSLLGNLPEADRVAMEASILQRTAEITSYLLGQAAAVLFLVDARAGVQPADVEVADWLRRSVPKHRVVLLANKCEGLGGDSTGLLASHVAEAYSLGFGDPVPISAESGEGLEDLYAAVKGPTNGLALTAAFELGELQKGIRQPRVMRCNAMLSLLPTVPVGGVLCSTGMSQRTDRGDDSAPLSDDSEHYVALNGDAAYAAGTLDMTTLGAAEEEEEVEEEDEAAAQALLTSSAAAAEPAAGAAEIPLQLAIAGLPNVGKSTLVNSLLGAHRVLTGPEPGLTRDAVRISITYQGKPMWLVDTAGWVKAAQARQKGPVSLARMDMERSIGRAHVVVLVLDAAVEHRACACGGAHAHVVVLMRMWWCSCACGGAHAHVVVLMRMWWCSCACGGAHAHVVVLMRMWWCSNQSFPILVLKLPFPLFYLHVFLPITFCQVAEEEKSLKTAERSLARWVWEEGRALVIAANKMDAVGGDRDKRWVRKKVRRAVPVEIAALLPQVHNVPIVFTSALHGEGGKELMQAVSDAYDRWNTMLPAARLKHWLPQVLRKLPGSCTAASVKSIVQVKSRPPTFVVRVTAAAAGDRSLARFFSSKIAADFGFDGVPTVVNAVAAAGDHALSHFFSSKIAADLGFYDVPVRVVLRTKEGTRW
ncbi:unnamed protein product [Closterium sp. Yama58-4]|nr:unnamed protein product [Closterium sp. Yama58-4]